MGLLTWTGLVAPVSDAAEQDAPSYAGLDFGDAEPERPNVDAILDMCDRTVGETSVRGKAFSWLRRPHDGDGGLTADAYYPRNRVVVLCLTRVDPYDGEYAAQASAHDLRLLTLTVGEGSVSSGLAIAQLIGQLRLAADGSGQEPGSLEPGRRVTTAVSERRDEPAGGAQPFPEAAPQPFAGVTPYPAAAAARQRLAAAAAAQPVADTVTDPVADAQPLATATLRPLAAATREPFIATTPYPAAAAARQPFGVAAVPEPLTALLQPLAEPPHPLFELLRPPAEPPRRRVGHSYKEATARATRFVESHHVEPPPRAGGLIGFGHSARPRIAEPRIETVLAPTGEPYAGPRHVPAASAISPSDRRREAVERALARARSEREEADPPPAGAPSEPADIELAIVVGLILFLELLGVVAAFALGTAFIVLGLGVALDACARLLGTVAATRASKDWGHGWRWVCALAGSPGVAAFVFNGDGSLLAVDPAPLAGPVSVVAMFIILIGIVVAAATG